MRLSRPVLAHVLLILIVVVWGSTFVLVKDALRDISPLFFNFLRMAFAFPILAVVYWKFFRTIDRAILAKGSIVGFFLAISYQFQTAGLLSTTASKSAFITGFSVALVPVLLLFPALRAKSGQAPPLAALLGSAAALCGLALLALPGRAGWASLVSGINVGDALTLASAAAFALQIVFIAKFSDSVRFEHMSLVQIGAATVVMALSLPVFERARVLWSPIVVWALVITAVLGTAAAFAVQSFAQEILSATTVVLIIALEPVFAWFTSYLFLGERLSGRQALGAALVLSGILATEFLPRISCALRTRRAT